MSLTLKELADTIQAIHGDIWQEKHRHEAAIKDLLQKQNLALAQLSAYAAIKASMEAK